MSETVPLLTELPPAPRPEDPEEVFEARAIATVAAQVVMVVQINLALIFLNGKALAAAASSAAAIEARAATESARDATLGYRDTAVAAAASAGASAGTATGAAGASVASAGNAATSATLADEARLAAQAAAASAALSSGLPVFGLPEAGMSLTVAEDGLSAGWRLVGARLPYGDRAMLRSAKLGTVVVDSLGLFAWVAGSTQPDDDATCLRHTDDSGAWVLVAVAPELADALWGAEIDAVHARTVTRSAACTVVAIAANNFAEFTVAVPGARLGAPGLAVPPTPLAAHLWVRCTSEGVVTVRITALGASVAPAGVWSVVVFNPRD